MSFCIHVPHFLRQNRIIKRANAFITAYDLDDLLFLALLASFPFFQILRHSTLSLLPICAFLLLSSIASACQKEKIELDFADFLILLILLLQISAAFTGYGRAVDALTAALLTSIWFSARRFFERRGGEAVVFLVSVVLLLVSLIGVGQYLFGFAELRWVDASRFGDIGGRVTSLFSNPNILAVYLLLHFSLALRAIFLPQNKGGLRVFYAATAISCAACILLTWSRGAWLGLLAEVFLFLLFYNRKTRLLLCFSPLLLLAVPLLPSSFQGRLLSIGDLGESSIRYRLQTWRGTVRMLLHHPFGIGVGEWAWRSIYPHYAVSGTKTVMHAHNVFLQVAAELGAVGIFVFLVLVLTVLWRGIKSKNTAAAASVAGVLTMGMFDHLWYSPAMLLPFLSILAFCIQSDRKVAKIEPFVDILHENSYHSFQKNNEMTY